MIVSLGDVKEPKIPFEVTSIDITGPYPTTSRGNKYLLAFIDHLTNYVEAIPIPDPTAEHARLCTRAKSLLVMVQVRP